MELKLRLPKISMMLYYVAKTMGLAPFTLTNHKFHPPTLLGNAYSVFLIMLHLMAVLTTCLWMSSNPIGSKIATRVSILSHFIALVTPAAIAFVALCEQKKIILLMNKLYSICNELEILGIFNDDGESFKNFFAIFAVANIIVGIFSIVTSILEPYWMISISIAHGFQQCIRFNVVLIYARILLCIRQRFVTLNEKLSALFQPPRCFTTPIHLSHFHVRRRQCEDHSQSSRQDYIVIQRIRKIEELHMDLCDLVKQTNHVFGIPILCISLQYYIVFIISFYWIYFLIMVSNESNYWGHLDDDVDSKRSSISNPILVCILRSVVQITEILMIAYTSATTSKQANSTRYSILEVWNDSIPEKFGKEIYMFSLQLLHKPLTMTIFDFLDLGYAYPFEIACTVAMYLVVLIQLASD
ncbi:putative gustatory receptor 28b [Diprion similis]|uniref:putative gustatory receptor 28b n=1 Tax=Diprion similis TaxID=362088 RepID=UPI001EF7CD4F|nr:putative gustatory receptor 28b [Diprion similis]